jgi:FixJ family two-component response regulator
VEQFVSATEFLAAHDPARPACLVLDMAMPGLNGLQVQQILAERGSQLPIIFLTGSSDVTLCVQAMKRGAFDYFIKSTPLTELVATVRRALHHAARTRQQLAQLAGIRARIASLTPREHEVLAGVVAGFSNKQIAAKLGAAEKTIKVHRGRVMSKMRVVSVADLVRLVEKAGPGEPVRAPAP